MDNNFVNQTMLTCIGNKRKLISNILDIVNDVKELVSKDKLNIVDGFAGSTVVSRALSYAAKDLYSNDLELYSYLMAKCYLETPSKKNQKEIRGHINTMNELAETGPYIEGIICKLYAPQDTNDIKENERCFYTRENALVIDTLRDYIDKKVKKCQQLYCLVPLLNKASINTNTGGVFKGFYKDNDIGKFGGRKEVNLERIMKPIRLDEPVWNESENFKAHCYQKDINELIGELPSNIDLIYLDPPYNQHPYGSNYFMLNVIAENKEPEEVSRVSGIPKKWNKSNYNYYKSAIESMRNLLEESVNKSKYILLSYNNEGIIKEDDWEELFKEYDVKKYEIKYNAYRASRNLSSRNDKVIERMYLINKK